MDLQFIGIDPDTGKNGSPTAWVDLDGADIVIQGYTADEETRPSAWRTRHQGTRRASPTTRR
ncbi:hypothetical protein GCM10023080_046620 [Streptomyces pseudoechinosporeus]